MSNYGHGRFLRESLPAMLGDPGVPTELLIIDDASRDDSVEVITEFSRADPRIALMSNSTNLGALANAARLLELASGDFVYWAAADDLVLPGFFQRSLEILARYPAAGLCSSLTRMIAADGTDIGVLPTPVVIQEPGYISPDRSQRLLSSIGSWFQGNTVIFRRRALQDAGGFREDLGPFADTFAAHVVALRNGACFIPEATTSWRILPDTYSRRVARDRERRDAMAARAVELMQGEHRADFPPGYADQWRRELVFTDRRGEAGRQRDERATDIANWLRTHGLGVGAGAGQVIAWSVWWVRMIALLPSVPPHVLRRHIRRRLGHR